MSSLGPVVGSQNSWRTGLADGSAHRADRCVGDDLLFRGAGFPATLVRFAPDHPAKIFDCRNYAAGRAVVTWPTHTNADAAAHGPREATAPEKASADPASTPARRMSLPLIVGGESIISRRASRLTFPNGIVRQRYLDTHRSLICSGVRE